MLWIGLREGAIPLGLFVAKTTWHVDLAVGVGSGALLIGVWDLMRRLSGRARELERQMSRLLGPLEPAEAVALALLSGFSEELFFRGAMQGSWGWLVTTVLFALIHTGPGPIYRMWTLFAAVAGLVLAGLMLWRGSLLAPVVAHALVNGINLARLDTSDARPEPE